MGARGGGAGAAHAFALDRIGASRADAGGVEQIDGVAVEVEMHLDHVARGAGGGRHDRGLAPRDAIEQRRLAGIGGAGDHHPKPVAQPFALRLCRKDFWA